ncbi:MAG TPA: hypothetical protein VNS19_22770 [Acidimicrobiales bacterium]|nr:hypothetical protein [Acidimicrobiales bacterium]
MHRSGHRRAACAAAIVLAAVTALVPARPASASIAGEAAFFASPHSDQVVVLAGGKRTSVSAYPVAQVLAGHFTSSDGAQAFLYNPGPGPDGLLDVRRDGSGLATTLTSMPVSGRFQPFVADLDLDGRDDIFWYGPGATPDYVWFFEADGSVTSTPMSMTTVARPVPVLVDGIGDKPARQTVLWYGRGSLPDSIWTFAGRTPSARRVSISGDYRIIVGDFYRRNYGIGYEQVIFYEPNGGRSSLWSFHRGDGAHRSDPVPSPGKGYIPVVTGAGMHGGDYPYWYGPGGAPEKVSWFDGGKMVTSDMTKVSGRYRVLQDVQGRSAAEEVIFLTEDTTARSIQLAPEHYPLLGTVTAIPDVPRAARGASTWFEHPVE